MSNSIRLIFVVYNEGKWPLQLFLCTSFVLIFPLLNIYSHKR